MFEWIHDHKMDIVHIHGIFCVKNEWNGLGCVGWDINFMFYKKNNVCGCVWKTSLGIDWVWNSGHSKVDWCWGLKRELGCYGMTKKSCCNNEVMGNGGNYEIGKWEVDVYHHVLSFNSLMKKGFNKKGGGARWWGHLVLIWIVKRVGHKDERMITHLTPTLNSDGVITYLKVVITLQLDCQELVAHIIVLVTPWAYG
jgi:hypothetical protein